MWKGFNRLSFNLTVFGALAVALPILLIMVLMGNAATKVIQQKTEEHFALQALSMQYSVSDWYQKIINLINILKIQPDIVNMESGKHSEILSKTNKLYPDIHLIYTANLNGFNVGRSDSKPFNYFGDRRYFQEAMKGNEEVVKQVLMGRTISKPTAVFASQIKNSSNEMVGILAIASDLKLINERVANIRLGKTGFVFVVDNEGKLIVHPNQELISKEIKDYSRHPAVAGLLQGQGGLFSFIDEQKVEWLAYRLPLSNGWGVIVQQQKQETFQDIEMFWYFAMSLIFILLILLIIFTSAVGRYLAYPIRELTQAVMALSNGECHKMAAIHRHDEIGFLANTFTQMAEKLQTSFEALEAQKNNLNQILEGMPSGVCVFNQEGELIFSNQRAHQLIHQEIMSGLPLDQISEVYHFYMAGTDQLYPKEKLSIHQTFKKGEINVIDDLEVHCGETIIPLEIWGTPIFDEKGNILYAMIAFQDITMRKQAEAEHIRFVQEQEAKNTALKYSQEIEAKNTDLIRLNHEKNEFLGIVSHDLKNPLSSIKGLSEVIRDSVEDFSREEIARYCQMIFEESEKMFQLITNLLDVNMIESGQLNIQLKPLDFLNLCQKLIYNYTESAKKKDLCIHFKSTEEILLLNSDQIIIEQILDNLLSNAIKYSPRGKHIFVRVRKQNEQVYCEIEDQGSGLTEQDQQKIFKKFSRLSAKPTAGEHSTGLGLFIVKKLINALGGEISYTSKLGGGSTFIAIFPFS